MKILLASDAFIPMINGVVASTLTLYKELRNLGHDVRILALSDEGKEKITGDFYYLKSFKVNVYPDARVNVPVKNNIIQSILDWNPDIVHTQTEFTILLAAKKIAAKCGALHIHTYHTMYEDYTNFIIKSKRVNRTVVGKISKRFLNRTDGVVAPTGKTFGTLQRYGVTAPISIIPTGIDISRFSQAFSEHEHLELRKQYDIAEDKHIIVYLGRISGEKNIDEIIGFIENDKDYFADKVFLIAGGGPYLEDLKRAVKEKNISDYVRFSGMVNPRDSYKFYKLGDVFCTASTSETQGLTYIEALASGTPVVCRYDDCIKDVIVNGKNGYTFNNYPEFRKHLDSVLYNQDLRVILKNNAIMTSNKYSSKSFALDVARFYDEAIAVKKLRLSTIQSRKKSTLSVKGLKKRAN